MRERCHRRPLSVAFAMYRASAVQLHARALHTPDLPRSPQRSLRGHEQFIRALSAINIIERRPPYDMFFTLVYAYLRAQCLINFIKAKCLEGFATCIDDVDF